jgi:signal peptide peptidase SppA
MRADQVLSHFSKPVRIERFFNVPLALWPGHSEILLEMLRSPEGVVHSLVEIPSEAQLAQALDIRAAPLRPYDLIDGIAIIPIQGILVHGCTWWGWNETDYASIRELIAIAIDDDEVRAIVLLVNSPGGEVAGCFDLADWMFGIRGAKPIWAILNENAFSAAYALASCADRIIVPRTGGTGSIGVISMHVDITAALEKFGIKVTTFKFGPRKDYSYPTTPLSDDAREQFQSDVDLMGEMFVDLVARNRKLAASKVRGTQAGCFLGELGVAAGLADEVLAPDEAFVSLREQVS